ncbi:RagB/SusD family nutrient uptake outer membrane protein [Pedobacter hartonius]|uniref:RagB/SusD domain-containing protein n=1 Tax=Pedobacter hartonius TaxID=425514 RepID=A0A1H4ETI3_9SPHI|nr:RagB/SusD family nutrient uptake outer membrane protein [Pedobacter hartonius]SEA88363.1 RagB/SusD domain-containing protein [Pedobacter hartonius]
MKINKTTYRFLAMFLIVAGWAVSSCRKFIEIPPPANSIVTSQVFADSANATAAITGIYINMMNRAGSLNIANSLTTVCTALAADELNNTDNTVVFKDFQTNVITITNNYNLTCWSTAYAYIYQANACIEGAARSSTISTTLKNRITGEAMFIRAYLHFYLVNLFGPVPLVTSVDYKVNGSLPRASVDEVYKQIDSDLAAATQLLQNDPVPINKLHVNRFAVAAFSARVALYEKKWSQADAAATSVINAGYRLEPVLNNVFLAGNQEQIWQMSPPNPGDETSEGQLILPKNPALVPAFTVTNNLKTIFEVADQRAQQWLKTVTVAGNNYTHPFKYKLYIDGAATPKEGYSMLRLAEQFLIRAEARAQQNDLIGALADLNVIRRRAGLADASAANQADALRLIMHERQAEFFCEWGHRWLDLKRTNTIDGVLGAAKTGWKPAAALFPIPYTQLQNNPFLVQNPGY